jgi:hypothetical protein
MSSMRSIVLSMIFSAAALSLPASAQDRGLTTSADALGGPSWQSRFERDTLLSALPAQGVTALLMPVSQPQTLRLLGDYQFSALRLGNTGGLRLTGGVLINLRQASTLGLPVSESASALPYAGVGYASAGQRGDWGFSADLGLAAQGLGSLRLDRLLSGGGLGLDGPPRLLPMVRLGMNLAF